MGIFHVDSAEFLDYWTHTSPSGWTISANSTYVHSGNYAYVWTGAATSTSYASTTLVSSLPSEVWVTMYIVVDTRPTNTTEFLTFGTNSYLRISNAGSLHFRDDTAATSSSSTAVLSLATKYKLWVHINNTTNLMEMKLDNGPVITHTYASVAGNPGLVFGNAGVSNATQPILAFDDIVMSDTPISDGFNVTLLAPNGNGANTAWTGSYTDIDEIPGSAPDNDSTYINSSVGSQKESWTLTDLSSGDNVVCMVPFYLARYTAGAATMRPFIRIGGVDTSITSRALTSSYAYYSEYFQVVPGGTSALNRTDVNSYEQGCQADVGNNDIRITAAGILVVTGTSRTTDRTNLLAGT